MVSGLVKVDGFLHIKLLRDAANSEARRRMSCAYIDYVYVFSSTHRYAEGKREGSFLFTESDHT